MEENKTLEQQNKNKKRNAWDIRPYIGMGLTVIIVFVICLTIFFLVFRFQGLSAGMNKVTSSITGVFFGLILAYLLNPILNFFENRFSKLTKKSRDDMTVKQKRVLRAISVTITMAVFFAAIIVLGMMIVPQLITSVQDLILTMNDKIEALMGWIGKFTKEGGTAQNIANSLIDYVTNWIQIKFFDSTALLDSLTSGVYTAVKGVLAVVVGLIVCVYVMMRKEVFIAQAKKIVYAIFGKKTRGVVVDIIHRANEVFGGFFIGKIIDSIIIGAICFVCVYFMKMPYPVLLAVIVGVTNIIPIFGPYIGAIPCLILIFLVSPLQSLYFLIFIFILQQVDGNIIGPKILGNSVGLSPFWIIFSVLLFGGCFGVVGMIFGVPIFALIYYIIKLLVEFILSKRKLPTATADYMPDGITFITEEAEPVMVQVTSADGIAPEDAPKDDK